MPWEVFFICLFQRYYPQALFNFQLNVCIGVIPFCYSIGWLPILIIGITPCVGINLCNYKSVFYFIAKSALVCRLCACLKKSPCNSDLLNWDGHTDYSFIELNVHFKPLWNRAAVWAETSTADFSFTVPHDHEPQFVIRYFLRHPLDSLPFPIKFIQLSCRISKLPCTISLCSVWTDVIGPAVSSWETATSAPLSDPALACR